ncbi:hypothetical protein C8R46DRAFT_443452 [Mycena filopes]|nr:hypothetical protein C8R46DRAFT_443452 [Mycena filopes]
MSQLDLTLGALQIGTFLSSTLWGVTTVQFYFYLTTPNKDPLWTKLMVYSVWTLESFHTIFIWVYMYRLTVTFYGVPAILGETHWSFDVSSLFDGTIGTIMYFAYRIRLFTHSWPITLVAWTGSLLAFAAQVAIMVLAGRTDVPDFVARFDWLVDATLCINLIVDTINTCGMTYYLHRERTGFRQTDVILNKLVMWVIETGLITALAAAVMLILSKALPTTSLWIAITFFYAKLYSNSFLSLLNSRAGMRQNLTSQAQTSRSWNDNPGQSGVHVTVLRVREFALHCHFHAYLGMPGARGCCRAQSG